MSNFYYNKLDVVKKGAQNDVSKPPLFLKNVELGHRFKNNLPK